MPRGGSWPRRRWSPSCALVRTLAAVWGMWGEAGGPTSCLGPGLPNHHLTRSLPRRPSLRPWALPPPLFPQKISFCSCSPDSRLVITAPNLSRRVLQASHTWDEAEPLIPSNPSSTQHLHCPPRPGGGSHLRPGPALCLHHPRLTHQVLLSPCWDHSSSLLLPPPP